MRRLCVQFQVRGLALLIVQPNATENARFHIYSSSESLDDADRYRAFGYEVRSFQLHVPWIWTPSYHPAYSGLRLRRLVPHRSRQRPRRICSLDVSRAPRSGGVLNAHSFGSPSYRFNTAEGRRSDCKSLEPHLHKVRLSPAAPFPHRSRMSFAIPRCTSSPHLRCPHPPETDERTTVTQIIVGTQPSFFPSHHHIPYQYTWHLPLSFGRPTGTSRTKTRTRIEWGSRLGAECDFGG